MNHYELLIKNKVDQTYSSTPGTLIYKLWLRIIILILAFFGFIYYMISIFQKDTPKSFNISVHFLFAFGFYVVCIVMFLSINKALTLSTDSMTDAEQLKNDLISLKALILSLNHDDSNLATYVGNVTRNETKLVNNQLALLKLSITWINAVIIVASFGLIGNLINQSAQYSGFFGGPHLVVRCVVAAIASVVIEILTFHTVQKYKMDILDHKNALLQDMLLLNQTTAEKIAEQFYDISLETEPALKLSSLKPGTKFQIVVKNSKTDPDNNEIVEVKLLSQQPTKKK